MTTTLCDFRCRACTVLKGAGLEGVGLQHHMGLGNVLLSTYCCEYNDSQ